MKKVDVLIPTYNRADYLKEAIESILENDFDSFRIIVYDDGSTDHTNEVIDEIWEKWDLKPLKLIYVKETENKGVAYARNILILLANAEYFMWQDSDDLSRKDRIQTMYDAIREQKKDVLFSSLKPFDETGNKRTWKVNTDLYVSREGISKGGMCFATGIFKNKPAFPLFDIGLRRKEDIDWLVKLIELKFTFGFHDDVLYYMRQHPGRLTKQGVK